MSEARGDKPTYCRVCGYVYWKRLYGGWLCLHCEQVVVDPGSSAPPYRAPSTVPTGGETT